MPTGVTTALDWLEQWSPVAFIVSGLGFLLATALLVVDGATAMTVPEMMVAAVTVPTLIGLSLVALPGFYRYVADGSPRLALAGFVAAVVAGASITLMTAGKVALALIGVVGFFLWMLAFFLSMLFYGVASIGSGEPSRVVGVLLLVVIVEPGTTLLNDVTAVDLGIVILYATLAVAGGAFLGIGYLLRGQHGPRGTAEQAAGPTA